MSSQHLDLGEIVLKFNVSLKRCERSLSVEEYSEFIKIVTEYVDFVNLSKIKLRNLTEFDQLLISPRAYYVNLWACFYLNEKYIAKIKDDLKPYTEDEIKGTYYDYYDVDLHKIARAQARFSILTDLTDGCTIETIMQYSVHIDEGYNDCTSLRDIIEKFKVYKVEIDRKKNSQIHNGTIPPGIDNNHSSDMSQDSPSESEDLSPKTLRIISITSGLVLTLLFIGVAPYYPSPNKLQLRIFNVLLSVTAGAMFAGLPGFTKFKFSNTITASGAAAFALIVYLSDPVSLTIPGQSNVASSYTLNGVVFSEENNEPIFNAQMIFEPTGDVKYTDSYGRFELIMETKSESSPMANVRVSASGHQPQSRLIRLGKDRHETFYLKKLSKNTVVPPKSNGRSSTVLKKNDDKIHIERVVAAGYIPALFMTTSSVTDHSIMIQSLDNFRLITSASVPFIQDSELRSQVISITYELDDIARNSTNINLIDKSKLKIINILQNLCSKTGCKFQIPSNFVDNRYFDNIN